MLKNVKQFDGAIAGSFGVQAVKYVNGKNEYSTVYLDFYAKTGLTVENDAVVALNGSIVADSYEKDGNTYIKPKVLVSTMSFPNSLAGDFKTARAAGGNTLVLGNATFVGEAKNPYEKEGRIMFHKGYVKDRDDNYLNYLVFAPGYAKDLSAEKVMFTATLVEVTENEYNKTVSKELVLKASGYVAIGEATAPAKAAKPDDDIF